MYKMKGSDHKLLRVALQFHDTKNQNIYYIDIKKSDQGERNRFFEQLRQNFSEFRWQIVTIDHEHDCMYDANKNLILDQAQRCIMPSAVDFMPWTQFTVAFSKAKEIFVQ